MNRKRLILILIIAAAVAEARFRERQVVAAFLLTVAARRFQNKVIMA
jgi:hypothetical protein